MRLAARSFERIGQLAQGQLAGAQHDAVAGQPLRACALLAVRNQQALVADAFVVDRADHLDLLHLQAGTVNPAGGLAQAAPECAGLALQQHDLARRRSGRTAFGCQAAARDSWVGHAPFAAPGIGIESSRGAVVHQEFGDIEADAAGADHGDCRTERLAMAQYVDVAQYLRVILAGDMRVTRQHPGGDHYLVKAVQLMRRHALAEMQVHPRVADAPGHVAQHLVKFFLARYQLGHVELPADLAGAVIQVHLVAAFGGDCRCGDAGRSGADHRDPLARNHRAVHQLSLVTGARVHQTTGQPVLEDVVQAGLVAGDAGVDGPGLAKRRLFHKFRVGQKRARQRHHVGTAVGEQLLGHLRRIDAVGGDKRHLDAGGGELSLHFFGQPGKRRARHAGGDGRHARFMPADAAVDQGGAGTRHRGAQLHHFIP